MQPGRTPAVACSTFLAAIRNLLLLYKLGSCFVHLKCQCYDIIRSSARLKDVLATDSGTVVIHAYDDLLWRIPMNVYIQVRGHEFVSARKKCRLVRAETTPNIDINKLLGFVDV